MITIEQLKDVKERTEALNRYLDIEGKKIQVEEEQLRTQAPGFWDDQKAAEAQMKKVKALQQWINGYTEVKTLADELQLAYDFHKDAPAPDRLYAQIEKMFRQFGTGTPLFCEGFGGIWLLPHLAGICWNMHDNRYSPENFPSSARYLLSPRLSWSPGLMLSHEYVANLPHNLNTKDATNTITRLTHSLVNGFLLKVGLLP